MVAGRGCRACFAAGGGLGARRTQDKKKTLLHVLMSWAKDKEPDLLRLDEDLEHVSEASQWSLTDLKQQVKRQGRAVYVCSSFSVVSTLVFLGG